MDKKITLAQLQALALEFGYPLAALRMLMEVESSGHGFSPVTGRIIIQFEPVWFKKLFKNWVDFPHNHWQFNRVEDQGPEYAAFNEAFAENPPAALNATSFGLFQLMGFNAQRAGFKTPGDMVDAFKVNEAAQVRGGLTFIRRSPVLHRALLKEDWKTFAYYYNGPDYQRNDYANRLAQAYARFK